ncbi:MAG: hypothetical protein M3O32_20770, partial [Actinomycetota bacterium]|nr:hypothetical protein [Actinomycetota bacterium]
VTARDVVKGITDEDGLHRAIREAAERSADGLAFVEPDLRAHHNPSRRIVLARLAETMAHRLATRCPACDTPGFGRTGTRPGLPCRLCGEPTSLIRAEINGCPACPHHVVTAVPAATADATWCASCNP